MQRILTLLITLTFFTWSQFGTTQALTQDDINQIKLESCVNETQLDNESSSGAYEMDVWETIEFCKEIEPDLKDVRGFNPQNIKSWNK
jgi:hypothetical protein